MTTSTHIWLGFALCLVGGFVAYVGSVNHEVGNRWTGPVAALGLLLIAAGIIVLLTT